MLEVILLGQIAFYYFFLMGLMIYLFKVRTKAVKEERVSFKNFKSYSSESPEDLIILQNHYNNHFQIPMFFTMAGVLAIAQNTVGLITITLAALFIFSRLIHSYIHLGSNKLLYRAYSFFSGVIIVGLMFLERMVRSYLALS